MTVQESRLVGLIGRRNRTQDDLDFINETFIKQYHKKHNQLKRVAKQAKARIYGWTE
jgi:hypothetical protein